MDPDDAFVALDMWLDPQMKKKVGGRLPSFQDMDWLSEPQSAPILASQKERFYIGFQRFDFPTISKDSP